MSGGLIVVDVCNHDDPAKLDELVAASVAYWTSDQKGFKLLSDQQGSDFLMVNEGSKIEGNVFKPGAVGFAKNGGVVLVFERSTVVKKKDK